METLTGVIKSIAEFNASNSYIDLIVIILFIAGGYFAKKWLDFVNWSQAHKTLITGTAFVAIYSVIQFYFNHLEKDYVQKLFISYCAATSFYELILKYLVNWVNKLIKSKSSQ